MFEPAKLTINNGAQGRMGNLVGRQGDSVDLLMASAKLASVP